MHLWTKFSKNHFTFIFKSCTGSTRFTIKNKSGRFNTKQEKFQFKVVTENAQLIYEVFRPKSVLFIRVTTYVSDLFPGNLINPIIF